MQLPHSLSRFLWGSCHSNRTMKQEEIRKKVLMAPLDHWTLIPFFAGSAIGLGGWAFSSLSGPLAGGSLLLMLSSLGIYANRLLFGWDHQQNKVLRQWRQQVESKREAELDTLLRDLRQDQDPRTQALLQDLRTLTKALQQTEGEDNFYTELDVLSDVDRLFRCSVDSLRESLELWETAANMQQEHIKSQLLLQREQLIAEVEQSLKHLGSLLSRFKQVTLQGNKAQELARLREELSSRLRIAEAVEARVSALRDGKSADYDENDFDQIHSP